MSAKKLSGILRGIVLNLQLYLQCHLNRTGRRKWQLTPVFLPGESQGQMSLPDCRLWGRTESDTTDTTQQLNRTESYNLRTWDVCPFIRSSRVSFNNVLQVLECMFCIFKKQFYLFLAVLGLHCFVGFSLLSVSGSYSLFWCTGFSLQLLLLLWSLSSRACWLQQLWLLGSRAQTQQFWPMGIVVP